jgi:hypothetical protein
MYFSSFPYFIFIFIFTLTQFSYNEHKDVETVSQIFICIKKSPYILRY